MKNLGRCKKMLVPVLVFIRLRVAVGRESEYKYK